MFKVKVLTDSLSPCGVRLVSVAYQAPRPVLAELNTHRALSRNAESSRARPFNKVLANVSLAPYYPDDLPDGELLGESSGMQATAPLAQAAKARGQARYRHAATEAVAAAREVAAEGFHKQDVNRLLEPFGWTRGVISATEWANFFALRCDQRAYPPFRFLARCLYVAIANSVPKALNWGEWHLPFITPDDRGEAQQRGELLREQPLPAGFRSWAEVLLSRWSAARCARVSYYHFGRAVVDYDKDNETYGKLAGSVPMHASPLEHPARCGVSTGALTGTSNFRGPWVQMRKMLAGECVREFTPTREEVAAWNVPASVFEGEPHEW